MWQGAQEAPFLALRSLASSTALEVHMCLHAARSHVYELTRG